MTEVDPPESSERNSGIGQESARKMVNYFEKDSININVVDP